MAPNMEKDARVREEEEIVTTMETQAEPREYTIVYPKVLIFAYWHVGALYGLYLAFTSAMWATMLLNFFIYFLSLYGVSAGAHRLWSHCSYKARLPLQILLMLCHSIAFQQPVMNWARDHRLHHKYCDTDADPHNTNRGLFFCHIGWLLVKKHPDVAKKGKAMDLSDLYNNPVLEFQRKHYFILAPLLAFVLPTLIPVYFWQETLNNSYHLCLLRHVIGAHVTFGINSVAHAFGNKPYDKNISPVQNLAFSVIAAGEGYHNYHHVFPFDYRVSEFGNNYFITSTTFIDFFAWIGWAYDLKHANDDVIAKRAARTGDGTDLWGQMKKGSEANIWGWDDKLMTENAENLLQSQSNPTKTKKERIN